MSLAAVYESLWDDMSRDFDNQLDSDTFEGFRGNVADWAGEHESEAVDAVAVEIWSTLHEEEPIEELDIPIGLDAKGILRNRGKFSSFDNIDQTVADSLVSGDVQSAVDILIAELPARIEVREKERFRLPSFELPSLPESRLQQGEAGPGFSSVVAPLSEAEKREIRAAEKPKGRRRNAKGQFEK